MVAVISKIVYSSIAIVMTSILSAIPIHSLTSLARKFWAFGFVWYCPSISYTESTLNKDHTGCWSFACSPPFFLKICPVLIQASETANNDVYIPQISRALPSGSLRHCFISVFPVHVSFCSRVLTQIFWEPIRIEIKQQMHCIMGNLAHQSHMMVRCRLPQLRLLFFENSAHFFK